jgi:diaminopimelate decarboxylase
MLGMLAALGAGFDCASVMELEAAQALGVAPERIIFANPCKKPADFRCAACARARGAQKMQVEYGAVQHLAESCASSQDDNLPARNGLHLHA